jgi:hypothetical protein
VSLPEADLLKAASKKLELAGRGLGWSTLGLFAGYFTGLFVPDAFAPDATLGYMGSLLMVGLYSIGVFDRYRTAGGRTLAEELRDIDVMFAQAVISEGERDQLRAAILDLHQARSRPRRNNSIVVGTKAKDRAG